MALPDLMLKAKVNMALARDPRVCALDVGVQVDDAKVTLSGDVDSEQARAAATEAARSVEGVQAVHNIMTLGIGERSDTVEMVVQRLLSKLEEEWDALPDHQPLTQAGYL